MPVIALALTSAINLYLKIYNRTEMLKKMEKTKQWIGSNLLELIIIALVTAFFYSYETDKANDRQHEAVQDQQLNDLKIITYNLAEAWDQQRDWRRSVDEKLSKHDEKLLELYMTQKRGGGQTPSLISKK
jgi:hypothetical protein